MTSRSEATLAWSAPNLYTNANTDALTATPSAAANTPSIVPSKRSDDDIQFISSQPVKKQKLTHTKLQIKITPPASQSHHNLQQHQPQPQGHSISRFSPILVPNIQLTPPAQCNDDEQETATEPHHDRRASTGMVGLPADENQLEASNALRGVSLPIYTSLESFVLNQPLDRMRPMSSPPLSPKQLPPHTSNSMIYPNVMPLGINAMQDCDQSATPNYTQYGYRVPPMLQPAKSSVSATITTRPLTPTSSPSPVQTKSMDKSNSSMPPPKSFLVTQHCEQFPNQVKQTHTPSHLIPNQYRTSPQAVNQLVGTKPPCQACAAQKALIARAPPLSIPIVDVQKSITNTTAQMPCPLMQSYPHSHRQFMALSGLDTAFHPTTMPINVNNYHGLIQPLGGMAAQQLPITQSHHSPAQVPLLQPSLTSKIGNSKYVTTQSPPPQPTASSNAASLPPVLQATRRKPARNLIVDIAETCREMFPFEEVAKRQGVPIGKVKDIFTALVGISLPRSDHD